MLAEMQRSRTEIICHRGTFISPIEDKLVGIEQQKMLWSKSQRKWVDQNVTVIPTINFATAKRRFKSRFQTQINPDYLEATAN